MDGAAYSRGVTCKCASSGDEIEREMYRGDSFVFEVQVFQDDGCTPQNLTGWKAWFTAKEHYAVPDASASIRLGTTSPLSGITITSAAEGKMEVDVAPISTRNFPDTPMRLLYDVQVMDTDDRIYTIERGTLTVNPDVTRAIS